MLTNATILALLDTAIRAVDAARAITLGYFRQTINIDLKSDHSPVTIADQEAERTIRAIIHQAHPTHTIHGEEEASSIQDPDSDYHWTIDPIDGTQSYIAGIPLFGTLIALDYQGVPLLSIIDMPALGERFVGYQTPLDTIAQWDTVPQHVTYTGYKQDPTGYTSALRTSRVDHLAGARLFCAHPDVFTAENKSAFEALTQQCLIHRYCADCYAYALLAIGQVDLVAEDTLKPHDFRALIPIVRAAGGVISNWRDHDLASIQTTSTVLASANTSLHQIALSTLIQHESDN